MSWTEKTALYFPYTTYDVDIVRTRFDNGTATMYSAVATVSAGTMSLGDTANYYGVGVAVHITRQ